jgi:hypothetical protein
MMAHCPDKENSMDITTLSALELGRQIASRAISAPRLPGRCWTALLPASRPFKPI